MAKGHGIGIAAVLAANAHFEIFARFAPALRAQLHQLADTFLVEDGMIKVAYDRYAKFDQQYGHLFTNLAYSHYVLRMEYRFAGKIMADSPKYVNLNSGVMLHAQPPQSMGVEQGFPSSLEFQFLADEGKGTRPTGNVCTPGTNLEMDGRLVTQHIVTSKAPTFPP